METFYPRILMGQMDQAQAEGWPIEEVVGEEG